MLISLLGLIVGIGALYFGGSWLVRGASRLAFSLGISELVVGLTVVSFGTSTPELLVSISAALRGMNDISVGNVVGSNIANIGLILGLSGLFIVVHIHDALVRREIPFMIAISILVLVFALDGELNSLEGLILFALLLPFIGLLMRDSRESAPDIEAEVLDNLHQSINRWIEVGWLTVGVIVLLIGAQLTVDSAVSVARSVGISELVIGLSLVAVGTSLPELSTTLLAAVRQKQDIAVGNIVGSNIFNILCVLGVTALIRPIPVASSAISFDIPVMIAFAVLLLALALRSNLRRAGAVLFLAAYGTYILLTFLR